MPTHKTPPSENFHQCPKCSATCNAGGKSTKCRYCGDHISQICKPWNVPPVGVLMPIEHARNKAGKPFKAIAGNGLAVICETLGMDYSYCDEYTSVLHEAVMVPVMSGGSVLGLYRQLSRHHWWKHRPFKAIAGGAGMQNGWTLHGVVDWCAYGRCEDIIRETVEALLAGRKPTAQNVKKPHERPVHMQAQRLYRGKTFSDHSIGCRNRCKFCQYSWTHETTLADQGIMAMHSNKSGQYMAWDVAKTDAFPHRIRFAVDGCSERLRFAFGKQIPNRQIVEAIEHIDRVRSGESTHLTIFNVGNFPSETDEDRKELNEVISSVRINGPMFCQVVTMPFVPCIGTPMQEAPASLEIDWSKLAGQTIAESTGFRALHSHRNTGQWTHLEWIAAQKVREHTLEAWKTLAKSPQSGTQQERLNRVGIKTINAIMGNNGLNKGGGAIGTPPAPL